MKRKTLIIIIVLFLLAVTWALIRGPEDTWICVDGEWVKHGFPSAPKPTEPCGKETENEANIFVDKPQANEKVSLPLTVQGRARVFEGTVNLRLKEKQGRILVEDFTTARSPEMGQFGPFEKELFYPQPERVEGILEVFQISAKDGTEIDKVIIPLKFNIQ